MTEPALTSEQSAILRYLFARRIQMACYCVKELERKCVRCTEVDRIKDAFPGTFVQACVDAAKGKHG